MQQIRRGPATVTGDRSARATAPFWCGKALRRDDPEVRKPASALRRYPRGTGYGQFCQHGRSSEPRGHDAALFHDDTSRGLRWARRLAATHC